MRAARAPLVTLALTAIALAACAPATGRREADGPPSIGLALDLGGRFDGAANAVAFEGALRLARDFRGVVEGVPGGAFGQNFSLRVAEATAAGPSRVEILKSMAAEGRSLIIAVGFLYSDAMAAVARAYPDRQFLLIDGHVPDLSPGSNLACVQFNEHEAAFLAGYHAASLAAERAPGATLGFIGGMNMPVSQKYLFGFMAGAAYADPRYRPTGSVLSAFVADTGSGYDDPKRASEFASVLYKEGGAALIFAAAGASNRGIAEAAARFGRLLISADADLAAAYAGSAEGGAAALAPLVAGSVIKRVDAVIYDAGKEYLSGFRLSGGYRIYGLANRGLEYRAAMGELDRSLIDYVVSIAVPADAVSLRRFIEGL